MWLAPHYRLRWGSPPPLGHPHVTRAAGPAAPTPPRFPPRAPARSRYAEGHLPVTGKVPLTCCGAKGNRTPDLCIANATLYQLSYSPLFRLHDTHPSPPQKNRWSAAGTAPHRRRRDPAQTPRPRTRPTEQCPPTRLTPTPNPGTRLSDVDNWQSQVNFTPIFDLQLPVTTIPATIVTSSCQSRTSTRADTRTRHPHASRLPATAGIPAHITAPCPHRDNKTAPRDPGGRSVDVGTLVELRGIEPLTSCLQSRCSTN